MRAGDPAIATGAVSSSVSVLIWAVMTALSIPSLDHGFHKQNFVDVVDFNELHFDHFVHGGLHAAADKGGFDRQLAMAAVDQHEQLYAARASVEEERVHGGANGPAGEEYVVYEDDFLVADGETDIRSLHHRFGAESGKIVAIERDVERANGYGGFFALPDDLGQALGQRYAATANSDQAKVVNAATLFEDFMRQPHQRPFHLRLGPQLHFLEQPGFLLAAFSAYTP